MPSFPLSADRRKIMDSNSLTFLESRLSRWQIIANRLFYRRYKARAEKDGFKNGYRPEPDETSSLAAKSLLMKKRFNWEQPLRSSRYVIFDTETTGFYPYQGDEIIAIGGVVVEEGVIRKERVFHELVNPYRPIPPSVTNITGITDEMVADKAGVCSVIGNFLDFIGDATLVAHNAEFDLAFMNIKLKWYTKTEIYNPVIDTYKLASAIYPELGNHDLDSLLKHHLVEVRDRHTALGDSLMTAEIFLHYLKALEEKNIETLKQLYYFIHLKNTLVFCT
jgi:DNA polymerase-3 subunit epsilon